MSSVIDICNAALTHLGEDANLSSLSEQSAQASYCKTFYPMARDSALEKHAWNFATTRAELSQIQFNDVDWLYAYALPSDFIRALDVVDDCTTADHVEYAGSLMGDNVSAKYVMESDENGRPILLTNQSNARLRYVRREENSQRFTPMFVIALSYHLASFLAGPIVKGDQGNAESRRMQSFFSAYLSQAETISANQSEETAFDTAASQLKVRL